MKALYDDGTVLFVGEGYATHELLIEKLTIFGEEGTLEVGKIRNIPKKLIGKPCRIKVEVIEQ